MVEPKVLLDPPDLLDRVVLQDLKENQEKTASMVSPARLVPLAARVRPGPLGRLALWGHLGQMVLMEINESKGFLVPRAHKD